ncbi:unnamed protein product [Larinioides sclopetarius]|uniref:Uncharacterized protein n=1 Tax=Larinioides sclopetarius TaxID=280406 RepID=A0AAV1Z6Q5_9ARAC
MMLFPFIVGERAFIPIVQDIDKKVESSEEGAFTVSFPGGKIRKNGSMFILAHDAESTVLSLYGAYLLLDISHPKNSQKTFAIIEELFFEKKSSHQDIAEEVQKIIKYCQFKK